MDQIHEIALDELHESPLNHRKIFTGLEELAADIRTHGRIIQPLLVRPRFPNTLRDDIVDGYELVFGHRRLRAAHMAGMATAPCMVRAMTATEARQAQISENLARADVHPIEEAEAFRDMIEHCDRTADQLAEEFGKSRSYVYGRLKLLEACPRIRDACLQGKIGSEIALKIARLRTVKLQEKALGYIEGKFLNIEDGGAKSTRQITELLLERFTLELKGAMFDPEDATLLPEAGACSACPKRAGNAPEFEDAIEERVSAYGNKRKGNPDACTDPDCFDAKKKAHLKRAAEALEAQGKTVIDGARARQAVSAYGEVKGAYVALKDVRGELAEAKAAAKKGCAAIEIPQTVVIQDPRTGKTIEAVKRSELEAIPGLEVTAAAATSSKSKARDYDRERKEREQRAKVRTEENMTALRRVMERIRAAPRSVADLHLLVDYMLDEIEYSDDELYFLQLWGWESMTAARASTDAMPSDDLACALLSLVLCSAIGSTGYETESGPGWLRRAEQLYPEGGSPPSSAARAKKKAKGKAKPEIIPEAQGAIETEDAGCAGEVKDVAAEDGRDAGTGDLFESGLAQEA